MAASFDSCTSFVAADHRSPEYQWCVAERVKRVKNKSSKKMKNKILFLAGICMLLVLSGCPYESTVPLGDPCSAAIDTLLTGKWVYPRSKGGNDTIEILPFNAHEFLVVTSGTEKGMIPRDALGRVFVSVIDDGKFINFYDIGHGDKWIFMNYEVKNNLLITMSPSDQFIHQSFRTSKELISYFRKNRSKPGFYETPDTAFRVVLQKK
jgi:hypothetical protein